jgi:hypothetical protein
LLVGRAPRFNFTVVRLAADGHSGSVPLVLDTRY